MVVSSITEVASTQFSILEVCAFQINATFSNRIVGSRNGNGFMFLEKGNCRFCWDGGAADMTPGSLIYLPLCSKYRMERLSDELQYAVIHFTLRDSNNQMLLFSKTPLLVSEQLEKASVDYIQRLMKNRGGLTNNFHDIACVSGLLSEVSRQHTAAHTKVAPAINYINENYLEPIDGEKMAQVCMLSRAQMYRLFKLETGMTPTEYRNKLRVEKACQMIKLNVYSLCEIAWMLGFENVCYFNRLFKQHTGVCPSEWLQHH